VAQDLRLTRKARRTEAPEILWETEAPPAALPPPRPSVADEVAARRRRTVADTREPLDALEEQADLPEMTEPGSALRARARALAREAAAPEDDKAPKPPLRAAE
jgi:hypothetical protein